MAAALEGEGPSEGEIDERFEYDAPRFYDFDEGSPPGAAPADGWFDTEGPKGERRLDQPSACVAAQPALPNQCATSLACAAPTLLVPQAWRRRRGPQLPTRRPSRCDGGPVRSCVLASHLHQRNGIVQTHSSPPPSTVLPCRHHPAGRRCRRGRQRRPAGRGRGQGGQG